MTDSIGNQLGGETSPYLLQHKDNPVHWLPWSAEALALAREQHKPILLSIGYSACHWCHVMAHESFEDPATAALMNKLFVNIKVDREERPDLDRIYQLAHQMLVQRPGGWPLTMFLTPDEHTPFFGGTYFPPEPRHGMPAFRDLLTRVAEYHARHGDEIAGQSRAIRDVFARIESAQDSDGVLDSTPLAAARAELEGTFDRKWGGFGKAPRFPNAPALERLLRHWRASSGGQEPDTQALLMCSLTLKRMCEGGINDQLGGGFCRYSVDDYWMIPHFEKMLYDNAALLAVYAWAGQATGEPLFADTARNTAAWMIGEMQSPEGGFYASLDADSEGEEGRYYVWDKDELRRQLDDDEFAVFSSRFGIDRQANFEDRWHLHVFAGIDEIADAHALSAERVAALLDSAGRKLLAVRAGRTRPGLDDKILTAWNGLAIAGLAVAAVALDQPAYAEAAGRAAAFLHDHCFEAGRLKASFRAGQARHPAYLDDYAFLGMGLLRLLEARWRTADLEFATALAEVLLAQFEDPEHGGFYFTAADHEALIHRPRPQSDDATPAGGALASQFLNRLGHLLGERRYLEASERALAAAAPAMGRMASAHSSFINALEEYLAPLEIVVIRGGDEARHWQRSLQAIYAPDRMVVAIPATADNLPGALAARRPSAGTVAYRCVGSTCSPPITSLEELAAAEETPA